MRNSNWRREELILALDLYHRIGISRSGPNHAAVQDLSELLNRLPTRPDSVGETYRNPNGVYMKLCNIARLDPSYPGSALPAGNTEERSIWEEFNSKRDELVRQASQIRASAGMDTTEAPKANSGSERTMDYHDLANMLGFESEAALSDHLRTLVAANNAKDLTTAELVELASRSRTGTQSPTPIQTTLAVLDALASLVPRAQLILEVATSLGVGNQSAIRHDELIRRIYEHQRFVGKEAKGDQLSAIIGIAKILDSQFEDDDLEMFLDELGLPTDFFYEAIRGRLQSLVESPSDESTPLTGYDEDEDQDEEEEAEAANQPVRAYIKPFSVRSLVEMVQEEELDVEPAWQRTDVWSLKKKRELIRSLILGIPLPSIILHSREGKMSIIDGKQRLLSIVRFVRNEFKLPNYDVPATSPLSRCKRVFYDKPKKASLPKDIAKDFRLREIPALLFEDVPESRLRSIFHLYNVAGMKLNAAEIRNAVYQANPIHRVLYILAGEGTGLTDLSIGGLGVQEEFKAQLTSTYPGARRRYQGLDFLARYLGYSRAAQQDDAKPFTHPSTSAAINNYFDVASRAEDPTAVAKEIVEVFADAPVFFDISDVRLAFYSRGADGKRKFSKLAATTHMVATKFLLSLINAHLITRQAALDAAQVVDIPVPEKQQSATIWDYQARVLIGLRDALAMDKPLPGNWQTFFDKMEFCLLPAPEFS